MPRPEHTRRIDERGSTTVEMVVALPVVLLVLFIAVQSGMWFYARSIALAAAETGARSSAALNSTTQVGVADAQGFVANIGGTTLTNVTVTGSRNATQATITVTGNTIQLVPWLVLPVSQTATLPLERYTR